MQRYGKMDLDPLRKPDIGMRAPSVAPVRRRGLTWLVLGLAVLAGLLHWSRLGVPVSMPPAPSARIACVSYAPFREAGTSPLEPGAFVSPARIDRDLARLSKRFDCVRTYSQSLGLSAVPGIAKKYGMQVLMGIWLSADRTADDHEIALGIRTARAHPHTVRAIVVGNEVLLRGDLPPAQLVAYIRQVRSATQQPVTYADVWTFWLRYAHRAGLARAVSFVTVHILPYWEDDPVSIDHAIAHVNRVYDRVRAAFPGQRVLIGETGWPSAGKPRRGAVPSRVNEARYVRAFLRDAHERHLPYNLIESYDQPWKRRLEGTAGGYWGLYDAHGRAKFALAGPVVEMPRWWLGLLPMAGMGLLFAALAGCGFRPRLAAGLAGAATGAALAETVRQMVQALMSPWAWAIGSLACAAALLTALACARGLARWLDTPAPDAGRPANRLQRMLEGFTGPRAHLAWLVAASWIDLLLVFDGRYRDYPDAAFLVPAVALALWLAVARPRRARAWPEHRLLATWTMVAALILVVHAWAANAAVWSWLLCNVLLATPVLFAWLRARAGGPMHPEQAADQ